MIESITQFLQHLQEADYSPNTITCYRSDLNVFCAWFAQNNEEPATLESITPSDIREFRQYMLGTRGMRARTVNRRLAALSALLEWAHKKQQIRDNPASQTRMVTEPPIGPRYLDKKSQYLLRHAIERDLQFAQSRYPCRWLVHQRDASLVIFLLNTGLRINEALNMRLSDVQIGERKGQVLINGKGQKQRIVPLNVEARKALNAWLSVRPANSKSSYIWISVENPRAAHLNARSTQRALERYARQAGIPAISPHTLRHTFAKNLIDNGARLDEVAALLGHASLNTTRMYLLPNAQDLEKAVDRLEE